MARYIEKDSALKVIYDFKEKHIQDRKEYPLNYGTLLDFINQIRDLPTEDVRPVVKGKWVAVDDYPHEEYECSVCGRIVEVTSANIKPEEEYPYCHCGAYMGADTGEVEK